MCAAKKKAKLEKLMATLYITVSQMKHHNCTKKKSAPYGEQL